MSGRAPEHPSPDQPKADRTRIRRRSLPDRADTPPDRPIVVETRTRIELPTATIVKILITIGLVWLVYLIRSTLFQASLGLLLAMVLDRPILWLQRRGIPRTVAIVIVLTAVICAATALLWFMAPRIASDLKDFWNTLPSYIENGMAWLQKRQPGLYDRVLKWSQEQQLGQTSGSLNARGLLNQGVGLVTGIGNVLVILAAAIFLLTDRGRSLDAIVREVLPSRRDKINRSVAVMAQSVNGYIFGQAINSALFGIFALVILTSLNVPAATVLALIAAIGDAIPQIGVTLATIPAAVLALTVSVQTAILVIALYVIYQQIENFITSPRVFSKTLNLSPLMTLFAVIIGGNLLGVIGVLFALPVAASIPPVWRIWTGKEMTEQDDATGPDPASGDWL